MGSEDVQFIMLYDSCKFHDNRRPYQSATKCTQIVGEVETFPANVTLSDRSIKVVCGNVDAALICLFTVTTHTRGFCLHYQCIKGSLMLICYMFRSIKDHHQDAFLEDYK
jgi:hypothetical protein